ncbi:MAG: hypothetical protein ACI9GB_002455, partial [Halioglobus sp.]
RQVNGYHGKRERNTLRNSQRAWLTITMSKKIG